MAFAGASESEVRQFYCHSWGTLVGYAIVLTEDHGLAEDAVQTAFVKLMNKDSLPRELRPYMFKAVRNEALQQRQAARREFPLPADFEVWWSLPPPQSANAESQDLLHEALKGLRKEEREAIVLKELAELTLREIAQIQQVSPNTVASWHRRGMLKLRRRVMELEGKEPS